MGDTFFKIQDMAIAMHTNKYKYLVKYNNSYNNKNKK